MSKNRGNSQRIQHRRGSAAEWTVNNPILFAGELGYETDTTRIKVGDGVTQWVNLAYVGQFGANDLDGLTDVSITSPASGAVLRYDGASWTDYVLSKSDVGLSNVDNTSDANKPVSTAQAAADAAVASAASSDATSKANAAQAAAIQRANHTGTQPASTITGLATVATSNSYTDLSNRPATFPPSTHTHTVSQVTDAGTIATQNANSVAITGGSINGTTIGATTASTGRFTTVEAAGADAAILVGTGSYGRFQLSGGNATGFLFGSFAALGDGVHLAYNYYANAAGTGVITNALGPTSRVTVGYGFVAFATSSAVNTAPTERVRIDGSGNVGIGTTGPTANLHVASASDATMRLSRTSGATLDLLTTASAGFVNVSSNHNLVLRTNNTDRVFVDTSGNVGIGTASPAYRMTVQSASAAGLNRDAAVRVGDQTNFYRNSLAYNNSASAVGAFPSQSGGIYWEHGGGFGPSGGFVISTNSANAGPLIFGTADAERMRIDTAGNVGIGTTSPAARLDVQGGRSFFSASSEQYAIGARFSPAGGAVYFGAVSSSATPDAVISNAGGVTLMTLQNGGNVGIGTTSPTRTLHVNSAGFFAARIQSSDAVACVLEIAAPGRTWELAVNGTTGTTGVAGTFYIWQQGAGGGPRFVIDPTGNVGIGTASPTISSGVGLHLSGSTLRLGTARTPASSTATGNQGEVCWDSSYLYVCIATNTWRRIALTTW
jgi:hypothetical protein